MSNKIDSLFEDAIQIAPALREKYLSENCTDEQLRSRVLALCHAHENAGEFLGIAGASDQSVQDTFYDASDRRSEGLPKSLLLDELVESRYSVLLRDSPEQADDPVLKPLSCEIPDRDVNGKFRLDGEIARGGMGAIIKARDVDLGRELAIKILLDSNKDKPEIIQRFLEEAQIGGQLQHPGIAPVFEMGRLADKRPFFAMKMVKGETLAAMLASRSTLHDQRPRLLSVFQQVCQTMAYVHSRGVIHRDLKPANIMVGAFGEVQVMDWGLAKILTVGGVADEERARNCQHSDSNTFYNLQNILKPDSSLALGSGGRSSDAIGSRTMVGSVMGTPAYMPPEQAQGRIDELDERSDVFGLGAILCEILTGKPPYTGDRGRDVYKKARRGDVQEALARIERNVTDEELSKILIAAIAIDPSERPRNAEELTEQFSCYLESVEQRLKQSESDRRDAIARANELRKRRKLHYFIGLMMLLFLTASVIVAAHFHTMEAEQRYLSLESQRLADHNKTLASQKETQRQAALEARKLALQERDKALRQQKETAEAKRFAEYSLHEARKNLYAAQLAHISQSLTDPDAFSRLRDTLDSWNSKEPNDFRGWEWYYLLSHTQLDTLRIRGAANYNLIDACWTPDGSQFITVGQSGRPWVRWDTASGNRVGHQFKVTPLNGHIAQLQYSPASKLVAVMGSTDNNRGAHFGFYNSETFDLVNEIDASGLPGPIAFSPDGSQLAINTGKTLATIDCSTGNRDWAIDIPQLAAAPVFTAGDSWQLHRDICWPSEGVRFAAIIDRGVSIFDLGGTTPMTRINCEGTPRQVAISKDGRLIAIHLAQLNDNIQIWTVNAPSPTCVATCTIDTDSSDRVGFAWHRDSDYLAVSNGAQATVFRSSDKAVISRHSFDERTLHLVWSPDGTRLASAGMYGHADIWDPLLMVEDVTLGEAVDFQWNRSGTRLVSWSQKRASVWDTRSWNKIREFVPGSSIRDICIDSTSTRVAIAQEDSKVSLWSIETGESINQPIHLDAQSVDFHPHKELLVAGWNNNVRILDLNTSQVIAQTTAYAEWAQFAYNSRWHPDGSGIVISSNVGGAAAWVDYQENKLSVRGRGNAAMSSDGKFWLNVPPTKREIQITQRQNNGILKPVKTIRVGANWSIGANRDASRILLPNHDGLRILHFETETPVIHWLGESTRAQWDAYDLRIATIVKGQLIIRDAIAGYANQHSELLLPWLNALVDDPPARNDSQLRQHYQTIDLIATAITQSQWTLGSRLLALMPLSPRDARTLRDDFHESLARASDEPVLDAITFISKLDMASENTKHQSQ